MKTLSSHRCMNQVSTRWKEGGVSVLVCCQSDVLPTETGNWYLSLLLNAALQWPLAIAGPSWAICCVHLEGHRHWIEDILHSIWPFPLVEDASTQSNWDLLNDRVCWTASRCEKERTHQLTSLIDHLLETNTNEAERLTGECCLKPNYRL